VAACTVDKITHNYISTINDVDFSDFLKVFLF